MQKKFIVTILSAVLTVAMTATVFAGTWKQDAKGWQYDNGNGSLSKSTWQWIDGKCYCFDKDGYMYANTTTPDGYTVNSDGAWTENGTVKTQGASTSGKSASTTDERLYYLNRWYGLPGESQEVKDAKMYTAINELGYFTDLGSEKYPRPKTYEAMKSFLTSIDWPNMNELEKVKAVWNRTANGNSGNYYSGFYSTQGKYGDEEDKILVHKNGVCSDFCETFDMLCKLIGINSSKYSYSSKDANALGGHEVVIVAINGKQYVIDPTITGGQAEYQDGTEPWEQLMNYDSYIASHYNGM